MTRREKIILAVTGLVAAAGLSTLLMGGGGPSPGPVTVAGGKQAVEAARTQAAALIKSVQDTAVTRREATILAALERSWPETVFYDKPVGQGPAKPQTQTLPRYTGYVELGGGRLAIIDGYEYQVGDELEGGGYKVVEIKPDQVTLENLADHNRIKLDYQDLGSGTP